MTKIILHHYFLKQFCPVKKIIAFLFLLAFTLQTFYSAGIMLWFFANQKYISKNLCENRNRPSLKCNGKCILSKKLKEAGKQEEKEAPHQLKEWIVIHPCIPQEAEENSSLVRQHFVAEGGYNNLYNFITSTDIFHPPLTMIS